MIKQLILGGVRSGKSKIAQQLAIDSHLDVIYIATSEARDAEMQTRINQHRAQRPSHWQTIEESLCLAQTIEQHADQQHCILVECLTLWLSNLLMLKNSDRLRTELSAFTTLITRLQSPVILVSNESNMGVTPLGELSRHYCDEMGILHQQLAAQCDRVILSVAGLPLTLKGEKYET